uniref:Kilbournase n=1 Tax=Stenocarpella maydis TaxID=238245 RepID=A0A6G9W3K1_9PEZI|nr:kilbournase [Stenocarpella maydis]
MVGSRMLPALAAAVALFSQGACAAEGPGVYQFINGPPSSNSRLLPPGQEPQAAVPGPKAVPKAYIVELKPGSASLNGRSEPMHDRFHKRAEDAGVDYQVRREFTDTSLFHGLSVDLAKDEDKAALEQLPEVKKVWPVLQVSRPTPVGTFASTATNVTVGSPGDGLSTDIIRGENYTIDYNLKMAGVDHLHARGIKGKGVRIAVIDTGVDYNHPALGGGFGPGYKIAFGRNYVTDDGQGGPDDPIATCSSGGHGTHVSGIIGGQDPKNFGFGLLGVAPEATLGMYRVFSCGGDASNDVVMQAMMDAYNDGADIVSMSLGSNNGFEDADPTGQIITNAKARGIATVVAAGNDGALGPMLTSSPAIGRDAIAVASVDGAKYPTTYKMQGSSGGEFRYSSLWPLSGNFTVYAPSNYTDSLVCAYQTIVNSAAAVRANGWNISETFLMVREGHVCDLNTIFANIVYQGFKGMIAWRDSDFANPYENDYMSSAPGSFVLSLDAVDGPRLYKAVTADPVNFRAEFTDRRFVPVDNPSAGFTSNYSTMGNTWEGTVFKPQLAAPGHLILSSWPLSVGGYATISGTSMATPFVSGCFALIKSAFPNMTVDDMANLLTSTAQPAKWWGDSHITHSVVHQGAGTINVWDAYNSGLRFQEGVIVCGEGAQPVARNITFTNTLGRSTTFDISHAPAGLMQRTPYADLNEVGYMIYGFPSKPIYATVEFETPTRVTLGAGESATVSFVVTPPAGLDPNTVPLYSGYIKFTSDRSVHTVPYQGLTYVVNEVPVLERGPVPGEDVPQLPAMFFLNMTTGTQSYETTDVVEYDTAAGDYPSMTYFARQPTYAMRVDLVAANTTFVPTYYGFNTSNIIDTKTPALPIDNTFGGVDSFYAVFEMYYLAPVFSLLSWWGGIEDSAGNSSLVPAGDYRFLLRLLPVEKNYDAPEDWVSWLGPVLRIVDA